MQLTNEQKKRFKKVIIGTFILLILGISYGIICWFTEIGIPCFFKLFTGLKCPGCGITHFIMYSAQFRFAEAIECNYLAPLICFYLADIIIDNLYHYIAIGKTTISKFSSVLSAILIPFALVWSVYRNIKGI